MRSIVICFRVHWSDRHREQLTATGATSPERCWRCPCSGKSYRQIHSGSEARRGNCSERLRHQRFGFREKNCPAENSSEKIACIGLYTSISLGDKNTIKIAKEFENASRTVVVIKLSALNTRSLARNIWNYFQLYLFPTVCQWFEQLQVSRYYKHLIITVSHYYTTSISLFPNLIWIWFLLPEHHNVLIKKSMPILQPMQLLTKFLSWNNHSVPAIHHKWTKAMCRHFICMLTHCVQIQGVAGGVENHPLLRLLPRLFHSITTPTHSYISSFSICPYQCPSPS